LDRGSGVEVVQDGRLVRHETFFDPAEALEAAGLSK